MAAKDITQRFKLLNPGNLDEWYGPYASVAAANAAVPSGIRLGKVVGITTADGIVDYAWSKGVIDSDLVPVLDLSAKAAPSRNLFNKANISTNKRLNTSGVVVTTGSSNDVISSVIPVTIGKVYTIFGWNNVNSFARVVSFVNSSGTRVASSPSSSSTTATAITFTVPASLGVIGIQFPINWNGNVSPIDDVALVEGASVIPYEPYVNNVSYIDAIKKKSINASFIQGNLAKSYSLSELRMVGEVIYVSQKNNNTDDDISNVNSWKPINPKTTSYVGKNLFDKSSFTTNRRINSGGDIVTSGSYTVNDVISKQIPIVEGQTYTVSGYSQGGAGFSRVAQFQNINGTKVGASVSAGSSTTEFTFTVPTGVGAVYAVIPINWEGFTSPISQIQLEKGSVKTLYNNFIDGISELNGKKIIATELGAESVVRSEPINSYSPTPKSYVDSRILESANRIGNPVGRFSYIYPPADFPFTFNITRFLGVLSTDFNWTSLKNAIIGGEYFVDPVVGLDTNTGSESSPLKSIHAALLKPDIKSLRLKPTRFKYNESWKGAIPPDDLSITTYGGTGKAEITTQIDLAFYPHGSLANTYVATNSVLSNVINVVADEAYIDSNGKAVALINVASPEVVNTSPNSFYYDSVNGLLYIRTFNSRVPDSSVMAFLTTSNIVFANNTKRIYAENIRFLGGNGLGFNNTNLGEYKDVVMVGVESSYSVNSGLNIKGKSRVAFSYCESHYCGGDGFDYNSEYCAGFEFQCKGSWHGYNAGSNTNNGSTAHANSRVIRVGCDYQFSYGKCIQDIDRVISYNVGCLAGNSLGSGPDRAAYATNSLTSGYTHMYLIECNTIGTGTKLRNFNRSTVYLKGGNISDGPNILEEGSIIENLDYILDVYI